MRFFFSLTAEPQNLDAEKFSCNKVEATRFVVGYTTSHWYLPFLVENLIDVDFIFLLISYRVLDIDNHSFLGWGGGWILIRNASYGALLNGMKL